jgi:hypothetical protein
MSIDGKRDGVSLDIEEIKQCDIDLKKVKIQLTWFFN